MQSASTLNDYSYLSDDREQYLTMKLVEQDYGLPIEKVVEIKAWTRVTVIPNSPRYMKGVLNLRGTIVPVIDLRLLFSLEEVGYDNFTVIVVINVDNRLTGIVVDSVSDVISVSQEDRCETPGFEESENRKFIDGLVQVDGSLLILLDANKLVNPDTIDQALESLT